MCLSLVEVVSLGDIRTDSFCNLISLCQNADNDAADKDCPIQYGQHHCNYYKPGKLRSTIDTDSLYDDVTSFFHLNCRGLSSNWDSFQTLLCDLQCSQFRFDVIGVCRMFRTVSYTSLKLPGYHELIS